MNNNEISVGITSERLSRSKSGVAVYTKNLINEISAFSPGVNLYLINCKDDPNLSGINKIIIAPWVKYFPKSSYLWFIILQFKLRKNDFKLNVIHNPEAATLVVKLKNQKKVVTIHDIIAYKFPDSVNLLPRIRFKLLLPKIIKNSDKIITDSYHSKSDLVNHFNVPDEKIEVIYLGVEDRFRILPPDKVCKVKDKYGLSFPFILYVGVLAKHKNIPVLLEAFNITLKKGLNYKLVIAGEKAWKFQHIFETLHKLGLQEEVIFTGHVPDEDLPALYNAADLFVYPSLYEGFGLPPLEAMACGIPVIVSNTSSLPEVVSDAGFLFDPLNSVELADAIYKVLTDENLKNNMVTKGLKRAKFFSWEKCAMETLNIYRRLCINS